MLNDRYFKTNCNIRPHFLGPMGGLKIEGPLYCLFCDTLTELSADSSVCLVGQPFPAVRTTTMELDQSG